MSIKIMTVAAVLFSAVPALAQHGVGNGGVGLICPPMHRPEEIVIADVVYGEIAWGLVPDLGDPELPWQDKVEMAIRRIPHQDSTRRRRYRDALRGFVRHAEFVSPSQISRTYDYLNRAPFMRDLLVGRECRVVQIANLTFGRHGDYYLRVDREVFQSLSNDQRAILMLHEIVYRDWLHTVDESIEPVYRLVSLLASKFVSRALPQDYRDLLRDIGWPVFWRE